MRDKANKIHYEWTTRACRYIRHPADRKQVQAELINAGIPGAIIGIIFGFAGV